MIDDMRRGGVATRAAEPLATCQAPDNAAWIVDAAITAEMSVNLRVRQAGEG